MSQKCSVVGIIFLVIGTLVAGTISTIMSKALYQTRAVGLEECGPPHVEEKPYFQKPYFLTLVMFCGESLCLVIWKLYKWRLSYQDAYGSAQQQLLYPDAVDSFTGSHASPRFSPNMDDKTAAEKLPRPPLYYFAGFCSFDMAATIISGIGLTWVDASLYQMLRGAQVVFAALASICLLRRKFTVRQWGGLGLVVLGLAVVGASGLLKAGADSGGDNDASTQQQVIGTALILVAASLWGIQSVLEEKYMSRSKKYACEPLELVGWEGVFGSLMTGLIVLPIAQHIPGKDCQDVAENTVDTLHVLAGYLAISLLLVGYTLNLTAFNFLSNTVSKVLSAVHRQLINATRTLSVWGVGLFLHYYVQEDLGEDWNQWSFVQLGGFFIVLGGTFVYALAPQPQEEVVSEPQGAWPISRAVTSAMVA